MTQALLFSNPSGSMLWAPEVPGLIVRLHGDAGMLHHQVLLEKGLDLYRRHAAPTAAAAWILDARQCRPFSADVLDWMATSWNLRARAAGVRHVRFVASGFHTTHLLPALSLDTVGSECLCFSQHHTLYDAIQGALRGVAA